MARTFIQEGHIVDFTAPAGGVTVGVPVLIGALLVIPQITAAEGETFAGMVGGVHDLTKVGSQAWATEGLKLYWDDGNHRLTSVATAGPFVGVAVLPLPGAGVGETTGRIRLNCCPASTLEGPQAAIADVAADAATDADETNAGVACNADVATAVATAAELDALATKYNALATKYNATATKLNTLLADLRTLGIIAP